MSGHSKWSSIKHKKGAKDAKRGKIFSKLVREITVAARGGADLTMNPTLRLAVVKAKAANMPADNIERAIKKGSGDGATNDYFEQMYEGYGSGGVAILIQCLTNNKNRTSAEIKNILKKMNGSLGEPGSVAYMFERKGLIMVKSETVKEDTLMETVLDAGAEDIENEGDFFCYNL